MKKCARALFLMLWGVAAGMGLGGTAGDLGAQAQSHVLLDSVEAALRRADFLEARTQLRRWQGEGIREASHADRERGLWLEARLEVDPELAEPLYRRMVLEYPGGRWSDQALHHLALLAEGRADQGTRDRWLQALVRDYPASPLREGARRRLETPTVSTVSRGAAAPAAAPAVAPAAAAPSVAAPSVAAPSTAASPAMTPQGPAATPGTTQATAPVPTAGAVASTPSVATPQAAPASESGRYTLQVGAFSDLARARAVETALRGRGVGARVVRIPGSELFRVRIGYFTSREAALREVQDLERRGVLNMDAMVRDDADQERTPA